MNNNFRIIFVHGYTASSKDNWYPKITSELEKLNIEFVVPDLPGDEKPHAQDWLDTIHGVISTTNKPLVLVGHSLGTRAILLYLEKYKPRVKAVFLIAAFANKTENAAKYDGDAYLDFFTHEIDLEKIKPLVGKFVIIHSKDDELVYDEEAVPLAKDLNAKLIIYEDKGHFSDPENASIILDVLRKELKF